MSQICGANWGSCSHQPIRDRRAKTRQTKKIRYWEGRTVSDEAILGDDLNDNITLGEPRVSGLDRLEATGSDIHAIWP